MKTRIRFITRGGRLNVRSGFTLIELLVVIAITAVLAGMLLPTLAKAKSRGLNIRCINNLKQLGMANRMFVDDSNDHLPYANYDSTTLSTSPAGWLYWAANGIAPYPQGLIPNPYDAGTAWYEQATAAYGTGTWFKYVNNPHAYLCPVDITSKTWTTRLGRGNKLSSYVMNGAAQGFKNFNNGGKPVKITDVWSPQCYLMWEPDEFLTAAGAEEFKDGSNDPALAGQGIGLLHSRRGGNVLALDSHVDFVTVQQFTLGSVKGFGPGPNGKTHLLWDTADTQGHP